MIAAETLSDLAAESQAWKYEDFASLLAVLTFYICVTRQSFTLARSGDTLAVLANLILKVADRHVIRYCREKKIDARLKKFI